LGHPTGVILGSQLANSTCRLAEGFGQRLSFVGGQVQARTPPVRRRLG